MLSSSRSRMVLRAHWAFRVPCMCQSQYDNPINKRVRRSKTVPRLICQRIPLIKSSFEVWLLFILKTESVLVSVGVTVPIQQIGLVAFAERVGWNIPLRVGIISVEGNHHYRLPL